MEKTAVLHVRLTPRGGRDEIEGWRGEELRARVAAPAIDGRANAALIRLLAEALGLAPGRLAIMQGVHARVKRIAIEGLTQREVNQQLGRP